MDLQEWIQAHQRDYQSVETRLKACRNVMLQGRKDCAIDMLKNSTVFAVYSIQTLRDRHENAYAEWVHGGRIDQTVTNTVYGNRKARWLMESLATFDYGECVNILREKGHIEATDYIVENFVGLSHTKASFALAMVGIWELACLDTNVRQATGMEKRDWRSQDTVTYLKDTYQCLESIKPPSCGIEKPFLLQWAVYDWQREEHARHMIFYNSILA